MNRLFVIALCLFISIVSSQRAKAEMMIEQDGVEILYFFSYHCSGCFALKDYVSLWEKVSNNKIRRIPVFKENEWRPGAYVYALSMRINEDSKMSMSELDRMNFATTMRYKGSEAIPRDPFLAFMLENNYHATPAMLVSAWDESVNYLDAVSEIIEAAETERPISTPSARVSTKDTVVWVTLNNESENPGIDFVTQLNKAIKRVQK